MSDLEKFIKEQKEAFDNAEPVAGHRERFERRLDRIAEKENKSRVMFWRVAAAIIVLVVLCVSVLVPRFNSPSDVQYGSMTLSDVSSDLADVELYYQSKLSEEYEVIDEMSMSDPVVNSYIEELNLLNTEYALLEEQLYLSGTHEKVVLAMIENFRMRLDLIEKLEEQKELQTKQDSL